MRVDPLGLFNPVKGGVAIGNAIISAGSAASGAIKIGIAIALLPTAPTGIGALPPAVLLGWGIWNINSSLAAFERAHVIWNQALCEEWGDASFQNLYGLLPKGTLYDDDSDPYSDPIDYMKKIGVWRFIIDAGYF